LSKISSGECKKGLRNAVPARSTSTKLNIVIFVIWFDTKHVSLEQNMNAEQQERVPARCRLIRLKEVMDICGLSRTSLYRGIKTEEFPAPVKLSTRSVAWLHDEVIAWVDARVKRRDSKPQSQ
jgi:predicted DNA-binding transcriptional regulator AlpA